MKGTIAMKKYIFITTVVALLVVGCGSNSSKSVETSSSISSQEATTEAVAETTVEDSEDISESILDHISDGNAKVSTAISLISYGSATTYEGVYDETCNGIAKIEEARKDYNEAIELCGDNSDYSTLKKRLQKVVDSIPSKPTAATSSALDDFTENYSQFITAIANLETETDNITKESGYVITHALK